MPKKGEKKQTKDVSGKSVTKKTKASKVKKAPASENRKRAPLPNSFKLTGHVFSILRNFWRPLLGIAAVYAILNLIFATGLLANISSTTSDIQSVGHSSLTSAFNSLGLLLSGANSGANAAGSSSFAESMLFVIESLVIIWALRHLLAGEKVTVKKSYYHAMGPFVPFVLILLLIILQLLPFTVGSAALSFVASNSVGNSSMLILLFGVIFLLLTAWSLYMVSCSIVALYIVTLPDVQPREALRSAKNLVNSKRLQIVRRMLFLPLSILVYMSVVMIPLLLFANILVTPVFFALTMLTILYAHTYLYSLYKGLLEWA